MLELRQRLNTSLAQEKERKQDRSKELETYPKLFNTD